MVSQPWDLLPIHLMAETFHLLDLHLADLKPPLAANHRLVTMDLLAINAHWEAETAEAMVVMILVILPLLHLLNM